MKEWEKLKGEKENLLKEKAGLEKGLTEKQGQLKGLKDGVSLEQLQKAAKIEGNIRQDQQQMAGLNKVTEGYQKNLDALKKANTEALKTPTGKPDLAGVADYEQKIKGLKAEKETLQKKIDEQQKEVQKLKEVPNVEAPKVEAPKVETPQVQGPQVEGVGKQVQGPQGGITSPSVPITEMEGAPKQGMKSPGIEGSQGPQVGAEKIDLSKYKVSPEASAKIGETPKNGKKTVLQTMDERGETPEFTKRKRGMSMGEGLGKQQGVGVGGRR
jgi:hypothetical protein